jgi:medium-chain acyl-[acyl-carrier-protein] hydrolase
MNRLVHQLAHELAPLARGDFSFFGHSMGALVAFELAHAWRGEGRSPRRLWLSGRPPPEVSSPRPLLHSLPDSAFVRALQERYGALPTSVLADRGLLALVLPALRADFSAVETYRLSEREPLAVPLSIVHGRDDPWLRGGAASGWARHTSAGMHEHAFPGGHFYLESSLEAVARCIACATSPAVP